MNLHIFSFLRVLALLAVTLLATPLMAQTAAPDATPERPAVSAQAEALVEVLRDESAREALISELERLSRGEAAQEGTEVLPDAVPLAEESDVSFGRRVAMMTKEAAQSLVASADRLGDRLLALPSTFLALDGSDNATVLLDALKDLALVIVTTYAIFLALRGLAKPLYRRMGGTAASVGSVQTVFLMSASALIDAAIVLLAWAGGYAIALTVFGQFGEIGIRQTMYLNAFLIVELIKVAMRFILSPSAPELRLLAIGDVAARYLTRWLTVIISMLGYGQLLVIPIINQNVSFLAGRAMSSLISLMVLLIALTLVLRNRRRVAAWLTDEESHPNQTGILRFLAERWHWPVILYLAALFLIVVARPDGMLFPVLDASGKVLAAILAGMLLTGAITRGISRGVTLPDGVKRRLPLLEMRLNRFVPTTLMVVRLLVMIAVVAIAADIIGIIDLHGWLESQVGIEMSGRMIATTMILLFGFLIWLALGSWIDYRLNPEFGSVPTAREATLLSLLRNAATIAILIITLMFALSELGVDIAPLLASAGVLGLAIGFGAQKLVQDIITGVFIQFESAINVGDVITVGGTTGTVERLTIRSVSLRDLEGAYHIIPFSSVDMVTNFMRGFAYFVCDMGVAYRENTEEVREAMLDAFEELQSDPAISRDLLSRMDWMGVVSFGDNAVVVRTRVKTQPGKQWGIGRAYNAIVKRIFDERGIEMPFPHRTLYFGEDKDGAAPAARLNVTEHRVRDVTEKPADRPAPPPASDEIIHAPPDDED